MQSWLQFCQSVDKSWYPREPAAPTSLEPCVARSRSRGAGVTVARAHRRGIARSRSAGAGAPAARADRRGLARSRSRGAGVTAVGERAPRNDGSPPGGGLRELREREGRAAQLSALPTASITRSAWKGLTT